MHAIGYNNYIFKGINDAYDQLWSDVRLNNSMELEK